VPPTFTSITLGITEIKWFLKSDKIDKALSLYKKMVERISQWCGDIHPMHT
jgi:pentatricopeptide repeat protein